MLVDLQHWPIQSICEFVATAYWYHPNLLLNYSPSRRFRCCFGIESRLDRIFKLMNALGHNLREGRLSSHFLSTNGHDYFDNGDLAVQDGDRGSAYLISSRHASLVNKLLCRYYHRSSFVTCSINLRWYWALALPAYMSDIPIQTCQLTDPQIPKRSHTCLAYQPPQILILTNVDLLT